MIWLSFTIWKTSETRKTFEKKKKTYKQILLKFERISWYIAGITSLFMLSRMFAQYVIRKVSFFFGDRTCLGFTVSLQLHHTQKKVEYQAFKLFLMEYGHSICTEMGFPQYRVDQKPLCTPQKSFLIILKLLGAILFRVIRGAIEFKKSEIMLVMSYGRHSTFQRLPRAWGER